jgi:hypothetical protein
VAAAATERKPGPSAGEFRFDAIARGISASTPVSALSLSARIAGLIPGGSRVAHRSQTREATLPADPLAWIPVAMRQRLKAGGESLFPFLCESLGTAVGAS